MRLDKLTTKFQEALGEAQSLALANDHAYIEPAHLLVAMLRQEDGPRALLQRAGVNVPGLLAARRRRDAQAAAGAGPGAGPGRPRPGRRCCRRPRRKRIKRGDQFIASEMFLLALAETKQDIGRIARENGLTRKSLEAAVDAVRGGAERGHRRKPKASARRSRSTPST